MKQCTKCHTIKSETDFYTRKDTRDGYAYQCKQCAIEYENLRSKLPKVKDARNEHKKMKRKLYIDEYKAKEREYRLKNREKLRVYRNNRDKAKRYANYLVQYYVKLGKISVPEYCSKCNAKTKVVAHHPDYNKPLGIQWLCSSCHGIIHRRYLTDNNMPYNIIPDRRDSMAIELDDRITVLETKDMKARYKAACKEQGADMSEVLRPHVRAYVEAWEAKKPVQPT